MSELTRRDLLWTGASAAAGAALGLRVDGAPTRVPKAYFGLHPFIESNPKAVFIRRTHVAQKMDAVAKRNEGLALARQILVPMDKPGIPVTHRIVLKPNHTSIPDRHRPPEDLWGTGTDPAFYEGLVIGMKEIGLKKFHFIEANSFHLWNVRGWVDINERHGIEMNECERRTRHFRDEYELTWSKVPEGVIFKRIPYYAPVNQPDTWLFNIAKWKAHGMCLTQSVKNEQGLVVLPFTRFCQGWKGVTGASDVMKNEIRSDAEPVVKKFFERHLRSGYTRYESHDQLSPIHQEIWAHKTCDNMSALKTGLGMVEGIIARDGDGFGLGNDRLANLVMFGKDQFRLDVIGLYLGGHEPGNVHVYRIAKERGLSDTFNPWEIPVYEWTDNGPVPVKLQDLPRTPLKTYYLRRPGEPLYHLANEPFDYDRYKV
ncbi:MAG: hypothetical protein ABFD89_23350 [Bryobacteraceae bacterium]